MTDKFPKPVSAPSVPKAFDGEIYQAVGKYARSAVLFAFEQNGGADGLSEWANENKDEFYTKLFPKIIARESEVTHHRSVDQLMDVIDGDYTIEGEVEDITDALPVEVGQGQVWSDEITATAQTTEIYAPEYDASDIVDFEE